MVVVHQQVVVPAQQHAVGQVGSPTPAPHHDVMRFAPGRWSIATGETASAVACGQSDPLSCGEQPLFAPDIDDLPGGVEHDRHAAHVAHVPLHGLDADVGGLTLVSAGTGAPSEVCLGDENAHRRSFCREHMRVGGRTEPDQLDERIHRDLLGGALVAH
jgi:hypothetical protein